MTKLTIQADCGDDPKKLGIRDLNNAFACADVDGILGHFTDDVRWQIIGDADLYGKEAVRAALEAMRGVVSSELTILTIITDGADGAANGIITTEQGGSFAFCDVYRFASVSGEKIRSMTSYVVALKGEG